jgi:hypothetical protein
VLGNKPDWIIWTAASLFSSSVDALQRYYPAVGIVILLSLLLAYLLFLAVFFVLLFHLPGSLLIRTIINFFNSMLSSSLVFFLLCCPFCLFYSCLFISC